MPDSVLGFLIDVVSCEDLIVLKLLACRILDRVDVAELLKANRDTLDFPYLARWVGQLRLQRAYADAWSDAFPDTSTPSS